ncbi:unnamed protein product [Cylicostephanus goldi]|uniref:Uncharacterized protein n=1 Tax=Cylicostephanus goldi TaxID=71465 RepID=A0A3P6S462_CYLGO|nr:unnamed protein product [Cylicostephanus goldi]
MDNTQKERVNYTFDGMTTQAPPRPRFKTTLIDEVVTFRPPTDPPVFATLLHSVPTSTRRPRIVKLNDGEVKHRSSGKVKKTNFFPRQKTRGHKRKLEKAVKRLRGNRKLVSRDVGPVGRRVPIPRGWRVTNIRRF